MGVERERLKSKKKMTNYGKYPQKQHMKMRGKCVRVFSNYA